MVCKDCKNIRSEKEIRESYDSYEFLKELIEGIDLEVNDTFIDIIQTTLEWVLSKSKEEKLR